jgi:hypothetical protein
MATAAKAGRGTVFKRNGVACAELKTLGPPKVERDTLDATNFDSANYEEFILGLIRTGDCVLGFNHNPADTGQAGLKSDLDAGTLQAFTIDFPFSATKQMAFSGIVKSWEPTSEYNGIMMLNVSIKVSGAITWT